MLDSRTDRGLLHLALAVGATIPGLVERFGLFDAPVEVETVLFGVAIMGAAFVLSWAAEVAQLDVSQTLAIAVLAIIAVLPEYAIDLFLAFRAGQGDAEATSLAVANMTGANRLLIGIGWATVVLIAWRKSGVREVVMKPEQRTDVGFLLLASLWGVFIPLRKEISFLDLAVLGFLFLAYIVRAAREEVAEVELAGAAKTIGDLPTVRRRVATVLLFLFSAGAILAVAEPFADSLREIGERFGISKFLLIQWIAPLASEAPEMIIAIIFVLRMKARIGLGTLISSKVNQWTLLVGTLPLVFSIGAGAVGALPLDGRQQEEVLLTAAQSLFAVAVIANLSISRAEALALLVLFSAQLAIPIPEVRLGFAAAYLLFFVALVVWRPEVRAGLLAAARYSFRPRRAQKDLIE
ncbi:MAG: sodium:calcium antiporter [Actinomycetota bacterium]